MIRGRQFTAVATALSSVAGAFVALFLLTANAPAQGALTACKDSAGFAFLPSPIEPWKGAPLRIIVAAEKPFDGELSLIAPDGKVAVRSRERRGGPPYSWFAEVA